MPTQYNAQQNKIEFLGEDGKQRELLRRPYITANFDGKKYPIIDYLEEDNEKLGYFNVLNSGETVSCFMSKKTVTKEKSTSREELLFRYRNESSYYLKKNGAPTKKPS